MCTQLTSPLSFTSSLSEFPTIRERLTKEPVMGSIVQSLGKFGWVMPDKPVEHSAATQRRGKLYVTPADLINASTLHTGSRCRFHIYIDKQGLGVEECVLINAGCIENVRGAWTFREDESGLCWLTAAVKEISSAFLCADLGSNEIIAHCRAADFTKPESHEFVPHCGLQKESGILFELTEENSNMLLLSIFLSWHLGWENHVSCMNFVMTMRERAAQFSHVPFAKMWDMTLL